MFDSSATACLFLRHLRMNRFKLRPGGDKLVHKEDKTLEETSITLDGAISRPLYFLSHILNQKVQQLHRGRKRKK